MTKMRAASYRGGASFELQSRDVPTAQAGEIAVRIAYCGICGTDMHVFHGAMDHRVGDDRVIGHEMSGTVYSLGDGVDGFKVGQPVVIRPLQYCGECPACLDDLSHICHNLKFLGIDSDGAMQEVWSVPAYTVHGLPESMDLRTAALVEPVSVACHNVKISALNQGEKALVVGGGPIGVLVAIVARNAGAEVVISEVNADRISIAQQLGFEVINPAEKDLEAAVSAWTDTKGPEVVFEVSGSQAGIDAAFEVAACRGRIVMVAIHPNKPSVDMFRVFWRELRVFGARVYEADDYELAIELLNSGVVDPAHIITNVVDLTEIQQAFEELDGNAKALKSIIKVSP